MNAQPHWLLRRSADLLITLMLLALLVGTARAQQPVFTNPTPRNTQNSSGTIAVTNTFQSIWVAVPQSTGSQTARRSACTIQNPGATNPMYVFFGPIASATLASSFKLAPGASVQCNVGGVAAQDQVSITGTASDTFYATQQ